MATLEMAIEIAAKAHAGQVDRAGEPYILHPLRIMLRMSSPDERIAAMLHDVVEDTAVTLSELEALGFSESILQAVGALTMRQDEGYEAYLQRAATNEIARKVKLADLEDNLNVLRLRQIGAKDADRLNKYLRARRRLSTSAEQPTSNSV